MLTPMQVYQHARARGLRFTLIGPSRVGIDGPADALSEMDGVLDQHATGIVAIVEEFSADAFPVTAAQAILRAARPPAARRRMPA
jgi:hypothetical protein